MCSRRSFYSCIPIKAEPPPSPKAMLVSALSIIFLILNVLMVLSITRFVLNIFRTKR